MKEVDDRLDEALHKLGMEMYGRDLTREQQNELIRLTEKLNDYSDREAAELVRIVQNELTASIGDDILKPEIVVGNRDKGFLQKQFNYIWNGQKQFIPEGAVFEENIVIAGHGSGTVLRIAEQLAEKHGGKAADWEKHVGQILSDKYLFDVHWYELNGQQYDVKIKFRKER